MKMNASDYFEYNDEIELTLKIANEKIIIGSQIENIKALTGNLNEDLIVKQSKAKNFIYIF